MDREVILFSRAQRIKEISLLPRLIYRLRGTKPQDPEFNTDLILPEA